MASDMHYLSPMTNTAKYQELLERELQICDLPQVVKDDLRTYINIESAMRAISPRGTCKKVKTGATGVCKDGFWKYVWRMARFDCGDDTTLPMSASYDISAHLDDLGVEKGCYWNGTEFVYNREASKTRNAIERKCAEFLDCVASVSVALMGYDHRAGARRWRKALGVD